MSGMGRKRTLGLVVHAPPVKLYFSSLSTISSLVGLPLQMVLRCEIHRAQSYQDPASQVASLFGGRSEMRLREQLPESSQDQTGG